MCRSRLRAKTKQNSLLNFNFNGKSAYLPVFDRCGWFLALRGRALTPSVLARGYNFWGVQLTCVARGIKRKKFNGESAILAALGSFLAKFALKPRPRGRM